MQENEKETKLDLEETLKIEWRRIENMELLGFIMAVLIGILGLLVMLVSISIEILGSLYVIIGLLMILGALFLYAFIIVYCIIARNLIRITFNTEQIKR